MPTTLPPLHGRMKGGKGEAKALRARADSGLQTSHACWLSLPALGTPACSPWRPAPAAAPPHHPVLLLAPQRHAHAPDRRHGAHGSAHAAAHIQRRLAGAQPDHGRCPGLVRHLAGKTHRWWWWRACRCAGAVQPEHAGSREQAGTGAASQGSAQGSRATWRHAGFRQVQSLLAAPVAAPCCPATLLAILADPDAPTACRAPQHTGSS